MGTGCATGGRALGRKIMRLKEEVFILNNKKMTSSLKFMFCNLILLLLLSSSLFAQKEPDSFTDKNAVFLELGGNGGVYSFNYDRIFFERGILKSAARVGISSFPVKRGEKAYWAAVIPVEIVGLIGRNKHHMELGIGVSPNLIPYSKINYNNAEVEFGSYEPGMFVPFRIGYRYQNPSGGLFLKVGFTPFLDLPNQYKKKANFTVIHGGIGIGKSF